jgi:hypothetical protein
MEKQLLVAGSRSRDSQSLPQFFIAFDTVQTALITTIGSWALRAAGPNVRCRSKPFATVGSRGHCSYTMVKPLEQLHFRSSIEW